LFNVDSGKEVTFDGEEDAVDTSAVAYFDRLCAGREGTRRDPKVVVNW
jgi:hypothetical protein